MSLCQKTGRRERVLLVLLSSLSLASSAACAPTAAPPIAAGAPGAAHEDPFAPLARFRSKRLALSLPLPDGRQWRIDDHSQPELVATHALTRSRVVVTVFTTDELVGRAQCEELARARHLVPAGDFHALEDQIAITQGTFDTRVQVSVRADAAPNGSLVGLVTAFGGFLRKCYAFVYSTEVATPSDEPVLSSRLAVARARVLGGLEIDAFAAISRDPSVGPQHESLP